MIRRTRGEESTHMFSNAIRAESSAYGSGPFTPVGTILGLLVGTLSFVGMTWWFFSFASKDSPAAFWIAGVTSAVVIVSVVSRTLKRAEDHDHVYALATWFGLVGTVAFAVLGLIIPASLGEGLDAGEDPEVILPIAASVAFFVGCTALNLAVAVLLALHWPRRSG